MGTYKLQHPGTCTGMFWREDPRPQGEKVISGGNWPRNGAILIGQEHDVGGAKYLEVTSWKQAGSDELISDCKGLWMPFDQGGLLLHATTL
ncbi:TPA: hypothetical protein N0F65_002227 [Lagenidium giganteum]|uniref:Uncharacterized protein n=1 Tax=Lagenidium giganteum TaxID=4803 RepID=A0AAV2YUV2_9STRA|nr:TPA: hypothetical protein N0F65_002227 [Lagenidium giganteum]